ncbi:MAG TPA: hypothetical protein VF085_04425 [Solirubrobacterales bacterium]
MARKLKIPGLALLAVLAVSGTLASAAHAAPFAFRSDGFLTKIIGESGGLKFTVEGGSLTCAKTTYLGEQAGEENELLLVFPMYENCKFGAMGLTADVEPGGCTFEFFQDNNTENGKFDVITSILCPVGGKMTITVTAMGQTSCTITLGEQTLGTGTVFTNGKIEAFELLDYKGDINVSGVKYNQEAGTGLSKCATADGKANGTYIDVPTFTGRNEKEENTNIWVA